MRTWLRYVSFAAVGAAVVLVALFAAQGATPRAQAVFNDSDGDSVIDLAEVITGSNPNDARSTPEDSGADTVLGSSLCRDGIDNDGDGAIDSNDNGCVDSDGDIISNQMEQFLGSDMNDSASSPEDARFDAVLNWIGFGGIVTCADGSDNDGDGSADAADSGCVPIRGDSDGFDDRVEKLFGSDPANPNSVPEHELANPGSCSDGIDNDLDGLTDSADESCRPVDNDSFDSATDIASLPFEDAAKITTAGVESGEPRPSCFFDIPSATVWYKYTPASDGVIAADTMGSSFTNVVAAWTRHGARFSEVGCASGFQPSPFSSANGRTAFRVTHGQTYYIQVGGFVFPGTPGNLHFRVQAGSPPVNDNFASPREITTLPFSDTVDTADATTEFGEPSARCGYNSALSSVWYRFAATSDSVLVINTMSSRFPAAIAAWTDSPFGLTEVGCSVYPPRLALKVDAGRTYYLQVTAVSGVPAGELHLSVETGVAPPNDDFANAMVVPSVPFAHTVDTFTATTEFGEAQPTCAYGLLANTVWYKTTASQSGFMKASVDNPSSPGGSIVAVYQGDSLAHLAQVACSDFYPGSTTAFRTTAGQTYYIQTGRPLYRGGKFPTAQGGTEAGGPVPTPGPATPGVITFHLETLVVPACAPSEFTVDDPTGDAIGAFGPPPPPGGVAAPLDITSVSGGADRNNFCLRVQFSGPIPPVDPRNGPPVAQVDFDVDENPDTGYRSNVEYSCPGGPQLGVELSTYLRIPSDILVPLNVFFGEPGPGPVEQLFAYAVFSDRSFQLIIPLDALGGDDAMRFAMIVNGSGGFDCVPNGGAIVSPHPAVPGDVNCDGQANSVDVSLILQQFAGLMTGSLPCQYAGDVNRNGSVGPVDATLILQHESGMLPAFAANG